MANGIEHSNGNHPVDLGLASVEGLVPEMEAPPDDAKRVEDAKKEAEAAQRIASRDPEEPSAPGPSLPADPDSREPVPAENGGVGEIYPL